MSRPLQLLIMLVVPLAFAGCASVPHGQANDDPLEPLNRKIFQVNRVLDGVVIRPAAEAYRGVVPAFVQDRLHYCMRNLAEPRIFANNLLQGRFGAAGTTFSRFVLNSIAGIGGMFDIATKEGLKRQSGDFGQTLHRWGAGEGPYLVLPVFGPSNVRDTVGLGVDFYTTAPGPYLPDSRSDAVVAVRIADGIDTRARNIEGLDLIEKGSLDFYAQLRSIVRQRRDAELSEVRPVKPRPGDELDDPGAPLKPQGRSAPQNEAMSACATARATRSAAGEQLVAARFERARERFGSSGFEDRPEFGAARGELAYRTAQVHVDDLPVAP
jgi:phospholipid-binding lipoprotein MlaA